MEYTIKLDQFEDQGALVVARVISVLDDGVLWERPPKVATPFEEVLITTWNDLSLQLQVWR